MKEPRTPFVSKAMQEAAAESFVKYIAEKVREAQAAYLSANNTMKFQHGHRWQSPANDVGDKSGQMERHSVESSLALSDVVKGDADLIFNEADHIVSEMMNSFERMLFSKLNEATAKTGNIVHAADHSSQLEAFAASLEKMEMSVDVNGALNLPTIFLDSEHHAKLLGEMQEASPEMTERIETIKAVKLVQATEREAMRKGRFERRTA